VAAALLLLVSLVAVAVSVDVHPAGADTGDAIVAAAASQSGIPYCDGGGGINGPSQPTDGEPTCPAPGYDCMSLAQYAVYQVTGITVPTNGELLPGGTDWDGQGTGVGKDQSALEPGDVVFFGGSDLWHYAHSGIYAGDGEVWDALQTGIPVGEHTMADLTGIYTNYQGGVSYSGSVTPPSFTVTTSSLPNATIGAAYSAPLTASGGTTPYRWKVTGLPRGLRVDKTSGVIAGTVKNTKQAPSPGPYTVTVTVTDSSSPKQKAATPITLQLEPAS
jgi:cell wall-associated NlpC family hydrolase